MSITLENRNLAATEASNFLKGHIPDKELNACLNTIKSATDSISAEGSVSCLIFYWRITLNCGGKSFAGNAGGIGSVGAGVAKGDIYLADGVTFEELTSTTSAFQFNAQFVYVNVNFFNPDSKFLGSFHSGGIGTCGGTGGGTGSWSD